MKNFGQKTETTNYTKLKTVAHCREAREALLQMILATLTKMKKNFGENTQKNKQKNKKQDDNSMTIKLKIQCILV